MIKKKRMILKKKPSASFKNKFNEEDIVEERIMKRKLSPRERFIQINNIYPSFGIDHTLIDTDIA